MRVTDTSFLHSYLTNLNKGRERLLTLQAQLATGKRVGKASDDPQATDAILRLERLLERNEQFNRNIAAARSMVGITGSALDTVSNSLLELKEIIIAAKNPTRSEELHVLGQRIDQLLNEIYNAANTRFNGKYIFGGTNTLTQPFTLNPARTEVTTNPDGISGGIEYPVSEGIHQRINISGEEVFTMNGDDLFSLLINLRDRLNAAEFPDEEDLIAVDAFLDTVLSHASRIGAIMRSLDNLETQLNEQKIHLSSLLSVEQDTDIAEAILQLKHEELMLEASLKTGARILPMSLLDFIR